MGYKREYLVPNKGIQEWMEGNLLYYSHISEDTVSNKVDIENYNYYFNTINRVDFNYLTQIGDQTLPASLEHIPLQRRIIDGMVSEYKLRPFAYSVFVDDQESITKKKFGMIMEYMKKLKELIKAKTFQNNNILMQMQTAISNVEAELQKEPTTQEEYIRLQQIQQQLPQMKMNLQYVGGLIGEQNADMDSELSKIERYIKYEHKDPAEQYAQNIINALNKKLGIQWQGVDSMLNKTITGKQMFYVDIDDNGKLVFESLNPLNVTFPSIDGTDYIQDGPWVKIKQYLPYDSTMMKYGEALISKYGENVKDELKSYLTQPSANVSPFVSTPEGAMLYEQQSYSGTMETEECLLVEKVWYKASKKINIKKSPNKYSGDYFRHFIDNEKELLDKSKYYYDRPKRIYVNRTNNNITYNESDVELYDSTKGDKITSKYITEIYYGVIISGKYLIHMGKYPYSLRAIDDYTKVYLPVVGPAFNNTTKRAYSFIRASKGIQDMYNIVYWHRMLMLALAGTKSIIFDRSQKASDLDDAEWHAEKKKGTIYIQTTDENGNPIRTNFNQWSMMDLSVSPAIQYLEKILIGLEDTMINIMGFSRARLGMIVPSDQVGTFKESISRSSLITLIYYADSDRIIAKAISQLVNLFVRYYSKAHMDMQYIDNDLGSEIFSVPIELLKDVDFNVLAIDNNKDLQQLLELREIAAGEYKSGRMDMESFVEIWRTETLTQLANKVKYFSKKAVELAQKSRQSEFEAQSNLEREKIAFAKQFEAEWKKQENQTKQMALAIEKERLDFEKQWKQIELNLQAVDRNLKAAELSNEKESEDRVVASNERMGLINAKLQELKIQLDYLLNLQSQKIDDKHRSEEHRLTDKKIDADVKAKKMVKEHASDK